mmetsp:Transcript_28589/g.82773  ORF Transcript_28589/g.82773 Transcript_28589/m.82773 type:complete len:404 (+) Transcript_28589:32-1243(+)
MVATPKTPMPIPRLRNARLSLQLMTPTLSGTKPVLAPQLTVLWSYPFNTPFKATPNQVASGNITSTIFSVRPSSSSDRPRTIAPSIVVTFRVLLSSCSAKLMTSPLLSLLKTLPKLYLLPLVSFSNSPLRKNLLSATSGCYMTSMASMYINSAIALSFLVLPTLIVFFAPTCGTHPRLMSTPTALNLVPPSQPIASLPCIPLRAPPKALPIMNTSFNVMASLSAPYSGNSCMPTSPAVPILVMQWSRLANLHPPLPTSISKCSRKSRNTYVAPNIGGYTFTAPLTIPPSLSVPMSMPPLMLLYHPSRNPNPSPNSPDLSMLHMLTISGNAAPLLDLLLCLPVHASRTNARHSPLPPPLLLKLNSTPPSVPASMHATCVLSSPNLALPRPPPRPSIVTISRPST